MRLQGGVVVTEGGEGPGWGEGGGVTGEAVKACVIQGPEGQVAQKRDSLHSGPFLSPHRE